MDSSGIECEDFVGLFACPEFFFFFGQIEGSIWKYGFSVFYESADVIAVHMGEEDGLDAVGGDLEYAEIGEEIFAQSGINKHISFGGLEQDGVHSAGVGAGWDIFLNYFRSYIYQNVGISATLTFREKADCDVTDLLLVYRNRRGLIRDFGECDIEARDRNYEEGG